MKSSYVALYSRIAAISTLFADSCLTFVSDFRLHNRTLSESRTVNIHRRASMEAKANEKFITPPPYKGGGWGVVSLRSNS